MSRPAIIFDLRVKYIWIILIYQWRLSSLLALQLSIMTFFEDSFIKHQPSITQWLELFLATSERKVGKPRFQPSIGRTVPNNLKKVTSYSLRNSILLCFLEFSKDPDSLKKKKKACVNDPTTPIEICVLINYFIYSYLE